MRILRIGFFFIAMGTSAFATLHVSLGYGLEYDSMLAARVDDTFRKQFLNEQQKALRGMSAGNNYSTQWGAQTDGSFGMYHFFHLPELRLVNEWGSTGWGSFLAIGGVLPQTTALYEGSYTLQEAKTCAGVDYANCPLAALALVDSSGRALYDAQLNTSWRSVRLTTGATWRRVLGALWGGEISFLAELGLSWQSFSATTQFVATRCSTGEALPCAQLSSVRVVQGESHAQSTFALGPHIGTTLRYEKKSEIWFAELSLSNVGLLVRQETTGYTSFVAGSTNAFSTTSQDAGVNRAETFFVLLPTVSIRAGLRFGEGTL